MALLNPSSWDDIESAERKRNAYRELARRELARRDVLGFTQLFTKEYKTGWIHREVAAYLDAFLEAVERKESPRLMIFLPPRHGKSQLVSRCFPPYILGKHPEWEVVMATYNQDTADLMGRPVRSYLMDPRYQDLFPGVEIAKDSNSVSYVKTTAEGSYTAVGIGGSLTARGAHVLIIDDPVKDREDADSSTMRERAWDWYSSTARTRLYAGAGVVILQCMTGDTRILRPDGTESYLRDIRPGDRVATCDNGVLTESMVCNWTNHGADDILALRLASGRVVRANERHPFLVLRKGAISWIRVRNLSPGDSILRVRDTASGVVSPAHTLTAGNQLPARDFAQAITPPGEPPMEYVHQVTMPVATGMPTSSIGMESRSTTLTGFSNTSGVCARFASARQTRDHRNIGKAASPSTTATRPEKFADYSVTSAIFYSAEDAPPMCFSGPWNTCDFIPDHILEVFDDGRENVYDVQVERTENFIANGCVSHNTRWHEGDLSGLLLEKAKDNPHADQWHVYSFPAIATEDEDHRSKGEPLCPELIPLKDLEGTRASLLSRDWNALYQQNPVPDEGNYFKKDWLKYYKIKDLPKSVYDYGASDYAIGEKTTNDYTVMGTVAIDEHDDWYVRSDILRARLDAYDIVEKQLDFIEKRKPHYWAIERGHISKTLGPHLKKRMQERLVFCSLWDGVPTKDKTARARSLQARFQMGKIYLPDCPFTHEILVPELLAFPAGKHDDLVDFLAWIALMLEDIVAAPPPPGLPPDPIVPDSFEDISRRSKWARSENTHRPKSLFHHLKK